ncbi:MULTISPECIES: outer membrane beta-barrel family protein [Sphingobacterium]|uniref:outer membrane beta-barrel family protein n=1 Tax=Sphingobacterium TaxID=28453 RepID=UPI00104BA81E|nr:MULTISPECIES: outer membrane beta-barrel family protein [Sphingobacterium]MCW2260176.1 outer membrane receptor protein involved in Fe transport [Sphingobacterium kitahiroshimense]TCR11033.1 outer membrane receptor protein involved in Fe transport [Sphingobacterium sp. JUb78]
MSIRRISFVLFFSLTSVLLSKGGSIKKVENVISQRIGLDSIIFYGKILEQTTEKVIPSATIQVISINDREIIDRLSSDQEGRFQMRKVLRDSILLKISHVGYDSLDFFLKTSSISKEPLIIKLFQKSRTIDEVSIVLKAPIVEEKDGKLIYNVDETNNSDSFAADELLRKVPYVSVDFNGEVKLRGSSSVKVFINDKPSTLIAGSVSDALKLVPASMIKRVEVITNPGAKYDAEGTVGIINIITKRDLKGINAFVNVSAGSIGNANIAAGGGISNTKFSSNVSLTSNYYRNKIHSELERNSYGDQTQYLFQESDIRAIGRSYGANLSSSYNFSHKNILSAGIQVNDVNNDRDEDISFWSSVKGVGADENSRSIDNKIKKPGYSLHLDHNLKLKGDNHTLISSIILSSSDDNNHYFLNRDRAYDDRSFNLQKRKELSAQIDYSKPLSKRINLEFGMKYIGRAFNSSSLMSAFDNASQSFELMDSSLNEMDYDQQIISVYNSYNVSLGKGFRSNTGLRYERTINDGRVDRLHSFENDFRNLLPSLSFVKSFGKTKQSIRLSYNQRLQRPGITFLNPFINRADVNNVRYGNPNLKPEKSHQIEVAYSNFSVNKLFFTLSPFFTIVNNSIQEKRDVGSDGSTSVTFQNIGKSRSLGGNIYFSYQDSKFSVAPNLNIFYSKLSSDTYSNKGLTMNASIFASAKFSKGFSLELYSNYNTREINLQGYSDALSYSMIGVKKNIINKSSSISLSMLQPFHKNVKLHTEVSGYNFNQNSTIVAPLRQLRLSFRYQFGKIKKSAKQDDSDVIEDKNAGGTAIPVN